MNLRRATGVLVAFSIAVTLSGCAAPWGGDDERQGAKPLATVGSGSSVVKKPIQGLIDRQGPPKGKNRAYISGFVIKVRWEDLQPTEDGPIVSPNAIDAALEKVRDPSSSVYGMKLKLRVFAGVDSPSWAKSLGGAPVKYVNTKAGSSVGAGLAPRFWTTAFGQAYNQLQSKLAAKYDDVAELREVTVSRCSTLYDEMFARQLAANANEANMRAAGYTTDLDKKCIKEAIAAHSVWKRTISDVAFGPLPVIEESGEEADMAFTLAAMSYCREVLGSRCGLQNNSLSVEKMDTPRYLKIYDEMQRLGPPSVIQTATNSRVGDPKDVLDYAAKLGVNSVELPVGYNDWAETSLSSARNGLTRNPLP
jgi:hypothetical protein